MPKETAFFQNNFLVKCVWNYAVAIPEARAGAQCSIRNLRSGTRACISIYTFPSSGPNSISTRAHYRVELRLYPIGKVIIPYFSLVFTTRTYTLFTPLMELGIVVVVRRIRYMWYHLNKKKRCLKVRPQVEINVIAAKMWIKGCSWSFVIFLKKTSLFCLIEWAE